MITSQRLKVVVFWNFPPYYLVNIDRRIRRSPDDGDSKFYDTSVNIYLTTRRNMPRDSIFRIRRLINFSYTFFISDLLVFKTRHGIKTRSNCNLFA